MAGHVTAAGVFVKVGAARLPCPHCGTRFGCDCEDWLEWMAVSNNSTATMEQETD